MQKNKKLIIVGSGETALIAYEYFHYDSEYEVEAFSVSEKYLQDTSLYGLPVAALETLEEKYSISDYEVYVAISSGKLNRNRTKVFDEVKAKGYKCASYVSSKAFVWKNVEVGENCFIFENNTLQPFVKVGNNVTLWSGNHIGHNTVIKDNCFISSHCVISGFCEIGENSFLGVNCTIENNIKIAKDNFIGARALIQKDTPERAFYQEKQTELSKVDCHRLFRIKE
ncbi:MULTISPECIES: acetyltransferase [Francisella]|uniref:Sugar O-acyltransferase n=1 Tax=Francisella opportunistica TaxID=2016517 RepID=A0A345JQ17_9GAMM|nr:MULTISPECIES: acetyltransferase [Francisella]APC91102.1 transferase, putative [Francisella sp. MA067296]AXH29413.1 sugar O-acyltransferase [Francisella opportunistica]AXH31065.1 sugar O-acyltransferase [Francisella opportunistica]AXH32710.1 sugar O-acyltransferase [Francisella opportunistica]